MKLKFVWRPPDRDVGARFSLVRTNWTDEEFWKAIDKALKELPRLSLELDTETLEMKVINEES